MTDALTALEELSTAVTGLERAVRAGRAVSILPSKVQEQVREVALVFFTSVNADLREMQQRPKLCSDIESGLNELMQLTNSEREKSAYLAQISKIRPWLQEAMIDVMRARGTRVVLSSTERRILDTLARLLPSSAASYEQALRDLSQGKKISWRGTGLDLREALREVIDHLAPDDKVTNAQGFKLESGLKQPTQKQKVRFILKARKSGSAARDTAEASLDTVEESIASLARSTYQRGAAAAHGTADVKEVRKLKGYVDALLVDLLEISD